MNYQVVKRMLRRLQEWLERSIVGTRLQEWIWRNRHLYRRNWAQSYLDTVNHPHRKQIVDVVLSFSTINSVLEIGCASGANLIRLRQHMPNVRLIGVDINRQAIVMARRHFGRTGDEMVWLYKGRADDLSQFEDASIDVVLADAVLMFIAPDRIKAVLAELCRVARKGLVLNEYYSPGMVNGMFHGGRWVYDFVTLLRAQKPNAQIVIQKSEFRGGAWDIYGALIEVRL